MKKKEKNPTLPSEDSDHMCSTSRGKLSESISPRINQRLGPGRRCPRYKRQNTGSEPKSLKKVE